MNRIITSILALIIALSAVSAIEITAFNEGESVTLNVAPGAPQKATITIPSGVCVGEANMTIQGGLPRINITREDLDDWDSMYQFVATTTLTNAVTWSGEGCEPEQLIPCNDLVRHINERLVACNEELAEGESGSCVLDVNVYSDSDTFWTTLSDLFINTSVAYTGPISLPEGESEWTGTVPFSCDDIYVCGYKDTEPGIDCEGDGGIAETVITVQRSPSLSTTCDFQGGVMIGDELSFPVSSGICDDPNITRYEAANYASKFFVDYYLAINENNLLGAITYKNNVVGGHTTRPGRDVASLYSSIDTPFSDATPPICLPCGLHHAVDRNFYSSEPHVKKTFLMMTDAFSNRCEKHYSGGYSGVTGPSCGTIPGSTIEEQSAYQTIAMAREYYETYNINVYTVAYGASADVDTLREVARVTDGRFFLAENLQDLIEIYREIAEEGSSECVDTCRYVPPEFPELNGNGENGNGGNGDGAGICPWIEIGEAPYAFNLNERVAIGGGVFRLDLDWHIQDQQAIPDDTWSPTIIDTTNVLLLNQEPDFERGRIILNSTDPSTGLSALHCFRFRKGTPPEYGVDPEPATRLLVTQGRIVTGYIEEPLTGQIEPWGPYRITAEVWQR